MSMLRLLSYVCRHPPYGGCRPAICHQIAKHLVYVCRHPPTGASGPQSAYRLLNTLPYVCRHPPTGVSDPQSACRLLNTLPGSPISAPYPPATGCLAIAHTIPFLPAIPCRLQSETYCTIAHLECEYADAGKSPANPKSCGPCIKRRKALPHCSLPRRLAWWQACISCIFSQFRHFVKCRKAAAGVKRPKEGKICKMDAKAVLSL